MSLRGRFRTRLVAAGVVLTAIPALVGLVAAEPAAAARATKISIDVSSTVFRKGELVFIAGVAKTSTHRIKRGKARLRVRRGGHFRTIETDRINKHGRYNFKIRPKHSRTYRVVLKPTKHHRKSRSAKVRIHRTQHARSFGSRHRTLAYKLDHPTSRTRKARQYGRTVTYRNYQHGILAKVGKGTWLVYGRMLSKYRKRGGVTGKLGAPVRDVRCGLYEGACIQPFQHGWIYLNRHAEKRTSVVHRKGGKGAFMAVALSQAGYREPGYRNSKYGRWADSRAAWCGILMSWISRASAQGSAVPMARHFPKLVHKVKRRGRISHKAKPGRMAYIDYFGTGEPRHVALVLSQTKHTITSIEGNVDPRGGGARNSRGVYKITRDKSEVLFYSTPRY